MATITFNGDGDGTTWWDGDNWDTNGVPVADDTAVIATGFTVAWDFANGARIPATAGTLAALTCQGTGGLTMNMTDGARELQATTIQAGTTAQALLTSGGTNALTVVGNITGGTGAAGTGLKNQGSGAIIFTGNVVGGSGANAYGIQSNNTGAIAITGNVTGGGGNFAYGVFVAANSAITITGILTGGTILTAPAVANNHASATVTLNSANLISSAFAMAYHGKPPIWNNAARVQYIQVVGGGTKYTPVAAPVLGGSI